MNDQAIIKNGEQDVLQTAQPLQESLESEELRVDRLSTAENRSKKKAAEEGKEALPFFLDVAQAAKFSGISESTINRWVRMDPSPIPSTKLGGMRRFPRPVLAKWCRRVSAERTAPPHRLAQITTQLLDEWTRRAFPSGRHGRNSSSSSGQRDRARPEVGKGLRLKTRDMYRKYVLGGGDGRDE